MNNQSCHYCQGQLEERLVTRTQEIEGRWVVIENLPALVCRQCGERYYRPDVHDFVVELLQSGRSPVRTETVDIYDAKGAA